MIKFFRHIRKTLLNQNNMGKYLKYAIGEIILVMIGILLALQVNNWNNRRLEVNKEQIILKNLQSDFEANIAELNRIYNSTANAYTASLTLLEIIKDKSDINPSEVESLLNTITNDVYSLDLNSASIDEIKSSGSLSIIKDDTLRKLLSDWSFLEADTEDDIELYYNYAFNVFMPSLSNKIVQRNIPTPDRLLREVGLPNFSSSNFKLDYSKTIRTLEFENEVHFNALNILSVLQAYKKIEGYLDETLARINANINWFHSLIYLLTVQPTFKLGGFILADNNTGVWARAHNNF